MPIYTMRKVRVTHDDTVVLDDVTLGVLTQAKIGVVGPNGSGKSTLLRVMAGLEHPSSGDAVVSPDIRVGILEQEPALDDAATVLGNVEQGVLGVRAQLQRYQALTQRLEHAAGDETPQLLDELGSLQEALDLAEAWDLDARIEQAMDALRCPPPDTPVRTLSGGERRRVALCKTLLSQPELLLLDEPTNHLDTESVAWLEQHLATYKGTVIAVTHDRYFLDHAAEWIVEIDRGHVHTYVGNYSAYLATRAERFKVEGRKDAKRRKRMADELAWIRAGERRHATSRARLTQYEELASHSSSNKVDFDEIQIPPAPRLGRLVLEADELTKAYGQRPLMEHLSFSLPRGGIVGVVGPNGVGKTTLFRMIVGEEQPDSGTLRLGDTVRISYVDQDRAALADNRTAWETISGGQSVIRLGAAEIPSRAYAATFGFKGADQQKPVALMSGGERNRLNLALTLKQGGNLLLLDEPTNDLDVESLASLENALLDFSGCAVVTAHDRWFLDRVATHILAWEGGTHWFWFEGNFAGYEANKAARLDTEPSRSPTVHRRLARE